MEQPFSCIVGAGRGVNGVKGVSVKGVKLYFTTPYLGKNCKLQFAIFQPYSLLGNNTVQPPNKTS